LQVQSFTNARTDLVVGHIPDRPILTVVVDTEEDFDWAAPFSRDNRRTNSATEQARAHEIFDPLGVKPAYLMDQAIVDCDKSRDFFMQLHKQGCCDIGAHLHGWLTPPYDEEVNDVNSFQCNLPYELEYQKIKNLRNSINDRFGFQPKVFKAGRYGIGSSTYEILNELGFRVDCSVVPFTNYRNIGGSNFYGLPDKPFWADDNSNLLSVPLTRGFTGVASALGPALKSVFDSDFSRKMKVPAVLARSNMVNRITLTPEGMMVDDQKTLIKSLYHSGHSYFSLAYHSSSLGVGNTSYVKTRDDLTAFLNNLNEILLFFKNEMGGKFLSLMDVYNMVSRNE